MSTYIDFNYKFSGPADELAKAAEFIRENAEKWWVDKSNSVVSFRDDGSLWWSGYGTMNVWAIHRYLTKFTRNASLQVWAYVGCTDGCCEGDLHFLEKGSLRRKGEWGADLGLTAAVAASKLAKAPDVDAAIALAERAALAASDGWDDEDWTHLMAGCVCLLEIADALRAHPSMLESAQLQAAFVERAKPFAEIRKYVREYKAVGKKAITAIDGLLAAIEGLEISSSAKQGPASKREAARI